MTEEIPVEQFFTRLERLVNNWQSNKSIWGNSDALCIPNGTRDENVIYSKQQSAMQYLTGLEFTDIIFLIDGKSFHVMASAKKIKYFQHLVNKNEKFSIHLYERTSDEGANKDIYQKLMSVIRKNTSSKKLGSLYKFEHQGNFIPSWFKFIEDNLIEKVEISAALGLFFAKKDDIELDLCKRAAVLTNKIMKHGFVEKMENIIDNGTKINHNKLSSEIQNIIFDPNKIGVKVSTDVVESCFDPIIQSGGNYDIKVSATSDEHELSPDVIICSLGARYKNYCATVARTYMVDAPSKVEKTYNILIALYNKCLEQMTPGQELKNVMVTAKSYLNSKDASLLTYLPKTLGFAIGIEFRDSTMVLNETNANKFAEGMIFTLSVGLHNVPLNENEGNSKLKVFSLLISDTVQVKKDEAPEVLTKISKEYSDVSYNLGGDEDEDEDGDDDDEDGEGKGGRKSGSGDNDDGGIRRSARGREEKAAMLEGAYAREQKQKEIMMKKLEELKRRKSEYSDNNDKDVVVEAKELASYANTSDYPRDIPSNQVRVDMTKEIIFLPINGQPVPFHISTIKNMTMPDADRASWLRVNFYTSGSSLGKEVNKNFAQLVSNHVNRSFIKEITYRSLNSKNLTLVFQQYSELRKRIRQREQKAEQEKDLVVQTKLVRIKDQRIPRLQDIYMRPQISGRKCIGILEAHQNGLRYVSSKGEEICVMYPNVKHAIYQPCDKTTMVLIHFHLKDPIMIGKKKQKDVQFYTEVIEASENLESSRRSAYDPDELDDEQRSKETRKRLNTAFKEFCQKVEKLAKHFDFSLTIDVPFRKSGFEGNCSKEMVFIQPTVNCLVNVTEMPFFVVTLAEIEHVHFERVSLSTRYFDLAIVFKNFDIPVRIIQSIQFKYIEQIQDWLNLIEITWTVGTKPFKWEKLLQDVKQWIQDGDFWNDKFEDGSKKPVGWSFLNEKDDVGEGEEDEEDQDSEYSEESDEEEEEESESEDTSLYDEDDDDDDEDASEEDDDESEGKDWDDLEQDAIREDKRRRMKEQEEDRNAPQKKKTKR